MSPRSPITVKERELERLQAAVTKGEASRVLRDELAFELWQDGMTQKEIAERLDRADRRHGGTGITHGTTQKSLFRMRRQREQELIEKAQK